MKLDKKAKKQILIGAGVVGAVGLAYYIAKKTSYKGFGVYRKPKVSRMARKQWGVPGTQVSVFSPIDDRHIITY